MIHILRQVGTLMLSFGILLLATGTFNTFIAVRSSLEGFPPTYTGLMMSGFYLGGIIAALYCSRLINRVGHIRAGVRCAVRGGGADPSVLHCSGLLDCSPRLPGVRGLGPVYVHRELAERTGHAGDAGHHPFPARHGGVSRHGRRPVDDQRRKPGGPGPVHDRRPAVRARHHPHCPDQTDSSGTTVHRQLRPGAVVRDLAIRGGGLRGRRPLLRVAAGGGTGVRSGARPEHRPVVATDDRVRDERPAFSAARRLAVGPHGPAAGHRGPC